MKLTKFIVGAFLGSILLSACSKEEDFNFKEKLQQNSLSNDTILLRKRKSNKPIILSNKKLSKSNDKVPKSDIVTFDVPGTLDIRYFLGRSYDITTTDIGNPDGVRFAVVDIERFLDDYPGYYNSIALRTLEAKSFSFSSFSRYDKKSKGSDKISGGFSLNLGLFSIGSKHKFTNAFSSQIINENKRVFGELNVNIKDASYRLLISSNTLNKIKYQYQNSSFLDELYNSPATEFIENYGQFVLTDYVTGGRANALFTGVYNENSSVETKESSMDNSINASYGFDDIEGSVDFGFGNSNGSSIAEENNIFQFSSSIKTYGGDYGFGSFTVPKSIDDININLSGWAASLNDPNKAVLIDINDEGLVPISDFIFEDNLKRNIRLNRGSIFHTPSIQIFWRQIDHHKVSPVMVLKTRLNDNLIISNSNLVLEINQVRSGNYDLNDAINHFDTLIDNKTFFYDLNVVGINLIRPFLENSTTNHYNIFDINEGDMQKFYNSNNGILYLLYESTDKKFAYAIHDDYILDTYGIRDWVDNMPTTQVSYLELANYTIIGL